MTVRAIIAEDEAPLARDLAARLQQIWPELELVAIAENGVRALELISQHRPDVVFLDIKMPGMTGLEVAQQLPYRPHIIFVTAYSEHAIEAFEREAVDYLLKPAQDERLKQTVARLQTRLSAKTPAPSIENLLSGLLQRLPERASFLQWIRAGVGNTIHNIAVDDVLYFEAEDKYTRVVTRQQESLVRIAIGELEGQLNPEHFQRIHRGTIVNLRCIKSIHKNELGNLELAIDGRSEKLPVSRAHAAAFRQM
ncbi:MAG: response regulator transcription factor [Candidatus Obscuribacterales bacterium]|nr:response regulator transcription factor [Steroidobacteraceae bacterium]